MNWKRTATLAMAAVTVLGFGVLAFAGAAVAVLSFVVPGATFGHAVAGLAAAASSGWFCRLGVRDLHAVAARRWP